MSTRSIREGLLVFYGLAPRWLTMHSKDLMVTLELADTGGFSIPSGPYKPGDSIDASGILSGDQTLHCGPAYYNGTSYPKLWYAGSLRFQANPVTAPGSSAGPARVRTDFSCSGNLIAYLKNPFLGNPGPPVFDTDLEGRGKTTLHLTAPYGSAGGVLLRDVRAWLYCFRSRG